ncbi:MAG: pentapeptide repeat-containing protein [Mariprofundales bacterium]|nr:pentapeptide repeat-containing protein [Mariprofundales bacterium]
MNPPKVKHDPINAAIREERIDEANRLLKQGETADFSGTDFRTLKLRGLDVDGHDFSHSYFRQADLRGLDLTSCNLEGISLHLALIHGTYFPDNIDASEIMMSVKYGTRIRVRH